MRNLVIAICFLITSGCASMIMESYVGQPLTAVINDYGMPSGEYDSGNGNRAFVWQRNKTTYIPGTTQTSGTVIGNQVFANSYTSGGYTTNRQCVYTIFAKRVRTDIDGPAAWQVTSFQEPNLMCQ
jgi:hypothetical protein